VTITGLGTSPASIVSVTPGVAMMRCVIDSPGSNRQRTDHKLSTTSTTAAVGSNQRAP